MPCGSARELVLKKMTAHALSLHKDIHTVLSYLSESMTAAERILHVGGGYEERTDPQAGSSSTHPLLIATWSPM
jgi:hypothetical protein